MRSSRAARRGAVRAPPACPRGTGRAHGPTGTRSTPSRAAPGRAAGVRGWASSSYATIARMRRITRDARPCHAGLLALALLALAGRAHGEPLADLLAGVAANARFATPARADVEIEC